MKIHRGALLLILIFLFVLLPLLIHFSYISKSKSIFPSSTEETYEALKATALSIEEWFKDFTIFVLAPLNKISEELFAKGLPENKLQAFELLEKNSSLLDFDQLKGSLSLFDKFGNAKAWTSGSKILKPTIPEGLESLFSIKKYGDEVKLCAIKKMENPPCILLSEFPIESKSKNYAFSDLLPERIIKGKMIRIEFQEESVDNTEVVELFSKYGSLFRSKEEKDLLYLALKSEDQKIIGVAKISRDFKDTQYSNIIHEEIYTLISYFLFCMLLLLTILYVMKIRKSEKSEIRPQKFKTVSLLFILSSVILWILRIFICQKDTLKAILSENITSPLFYGISGFYNLFKSPVDLFITSIAVLFQVVLIVPLLEILRKKGLTKIYLFLLSTLATVISIGCIIFSLFITRYVILNSRINILSFDYGNYAIIRLILQISIILFLMASGFLFVSSIFSFFSTFTTNKLSQLKVASFKSFIFLSIISALAAFLILNFTYSRLKKNIILKESKLGILYQEARNKQLLNESLKKVAFSSTLPINLLDYESIDETLAFDLWKKTELFTLGIHSSLEIYNREGFLISRFSNNLPSFDETIQAPESGPFEIKISEEEFSIGSASGKVLHGELPIIFGSIVAGTAVIHILNEPENIPFLTLGRSFSKFYEEPETNLLYSELIGAQPPFIIYNKDAKISFSNILNPPYLSKDIIQKYKEDEEWQLVSVSGSPYKLYILGQGEKFYITGYMANSFFKDASLFVKFCLLSMIISTIILLLLRIIYRPSTLTPFNLKSFIYYIRMSYYRKLLIAIIIASLIPLLFLSFLIQGVITNKANEAIYNTGLNLLAASSRVVKDYLSAQAEEVGVNAEEAINDEVLFWLSKVVNQDITLFSGGSLIASSRRDLFLAGILPKRLDSDVYKKIILNNEPFHIKEESFGNKLFYTLYSALNLEGFKEGVISIPLNVSYSRILMEAKNVGDMILLVTILTLFLLAAISYVIASSVSKPIESLVSATMRITSGDYDTHVSSKTSDETKLLTESFNKMALSLKVQREDLRKRKDYIEKILKNITTGVISTDHNGNIVTTNPAALSFLSPDDALSEGENLLKFLSRHKKYDGLKNLLEKSLHSDNERVETELEMPIDKKLSQLKIVIFPFFEQETAPSGRILLMEDITEMIKSNRLSAWAEMAKNIAHEIKNPLTPIQLSAEHLKSVFKDDRKDMNTLFENCIATIIKQVNELRRISADFSAYSRIPELKKEKVNLVALMKEILIPYRVSLPKRIKLIESYQDIPTILIDHKVMKGALINIIENSIQAIPWQGEIKISVQRHSDKAEIIIEDTGEGIPEENLDKLFEPYFSTKEGGTGLGLAISRKVIEAHGGTIQAESKKVKGTKMLIRLLL